MCLQQLNVGQKEKACIDITCHWINSNSLKWKSISLACCRLPDCHTYTPVLQKMHIKYKIQNKIVSTTTDDESNFVIAFCTYSHTIILYNFYKQFLFLSKDLISSEKIEDYL